MPAPPFLTCSQRNWSKGFSSCRCCVHWNRINYFPRMNRSVDSYFCSLLFCFALLCKCKNPCSGCRMVGSCVAKPAQSTNRMWIFHLIYGDNPNIIRIALVFIWQVHIHLSLLCHSVDVDAFINAVKYVYSSAHCVRYLIAVVSDNNRTVAY